ncbi:MAG: GNAT family N-acetyltransferase [Natrialbaceae archaeon]|nr:GNAT family N-acetyltransferase [Natrialbaceae archaeon]
MVPERVYPTERTGPFPHPPSTLEDGQGRQISLSSLKPDEPRVEELVEMYSTYDPADRAQGIPPTGESAVRDWLQDILDSGINLVAVHDTVVGHATLVPDVAPGTTIVDPGAHEWELAIFVTHSHQRAGIGRALLEHVLGRAAARGVEFVWLTVERWNTPAIALYSSVGFEECGTERFEYEMSIRLEGPD